MTQHLFLGQIADEATPTSAAAELYRWAEGYGNSVGTDVPLLLETDDITPGGPGNRVLGRRLYVPFRHWGACTVKVTPVIDLNQTLPSTTKAYLAGTTPEDAVLTVPLANPLTWVRARIEVTSRDGRVEVYRPSFAFKALGVGAAPAVAEAQG